MLVKLIVAFDKNRGIGFKNTIPWFIKGELKWVAETTKQTQSPDKVNALIMGKNTWLSLPKERRPLAGRHNVIVSKTLYEYNELSQNDNVSVFPDVESALGFCRVNENIESAFIFGGSGIYKHVIDNDLVDIYLTTKVQGEYECDTFFPKLPENFKQVDEKEYIYDYETVLRNTYIVF
jgi:dihydrofolate reductase